MKTEDKIYEKVPTNEKYEKDVPEAVHGFGIRHVQIAILFMSLSVSFVARGHLGVTIVAMTAHDDNNTKETDTNGTINATEHDHNNPWTAFKTYNWSKPYQEMVLSSFFLGYMIMMSPIALVCQRWGGKVPLQISLLINGIVSILTPWMAYWGGWKAVSACRVMQGLSQAGTYPGIQTLLAQWAPVSEKATLSSYVYTGIAIGTIVGFQISGILADTTLGWPLTFWVIGVLCLVTFVLLTIFGAASPLVHKTISEEEKNYIRGSSEPGPIQRRKAPWRAMLTSRVVWSVFVTHAGGGVTFVFFFTQVPSYVHYILGIDVKSSGLLSSLPYVFSFFTSIGYGVMSDFFTNRNILSVRNARRICNTLSQTGIAVALICTTFATDIVTAMACLIIGLGLYMGTHSGGWMLTYIDIAPNYSGTLLALGNTLTLIVVLIMPVLVSNIVVDVRNAVQWRIMISIVASLSVLTNIVYVLFMSADVQPWHDGVAYESEEEKKTKQEERNNIKVL